MIGPVFLKEDLVEKFRRHILEFKYYKIIQQGLSNPNCKSQSFAKDEADLLVDSFVNSSFPIICKAGSKSSIPFFNYHVALRQGERRKEFLVHELLVREPKQENCIKGILMACYMLIGNSRFEVEKIIVPFCITDISQFVEFIIERDIDKKTTSISKGKLQNSYSNFT